MAADTLGVRRRAALDAALARCMDGARVRSVEGVGGGCISTALCATLEDGKRIFVKVARGHDPALLHAEVRGLEALRRTGTVRVPSMIAHGADWIALEWLEPGHADAGAWRALGGQLAALHRKTGAWGGAADNFIGTLPQSNAAADCWAQFWVEQRLHPQLVRAGAGLPAAAGARFERLAAALPELLAPAEAEGASLLHGDLWRGNAHPLAAGGVALLDPASYHGHREVDLAMAELFGGFPHAFRDGYQEAWPLLRGWQRRRAIYQLYYLLVHFNLFGGSYLGQTLDALARTGF